MKKQILIVDDEAPIRKLFACTIEADNRRILTAASGAEALELMKKERIDLVLLDLNMPGIDGADTLAEIRKLNQAVPVYVVTGFKDAFIEKLTKLRNADVSFEVLNKPVEKAQLCAVVESVLNTISTETLSDGGIW